MFSIYCSNIEFDLGSEFKTILYILIGAFLLFSRFYRMAIKKQSEKQINKRPIDARKSEDIFKQLQKSLQTGKEVKQEPMVEGGKKRVSMQKIHSDRIFTQNSGLRNYKGLKESKFKKKGLSVQEIADENESFAREALLYNFDIKKAVIFSEILKRPQY